MGLPMDIPTDLPKYVRYDFLMFLLGIILMFISCYFLIVQQKHDYFYFFILFSSAVLVIIYSAEMEEHHRDEMELMKLNYLKEKMTLTSEFYKKDLISKRILNDTICVIKTELLDTLIERNKRTRKVVKSS